MPICQFQSGALHADTVTAGHVLDVRHLLHPPPAACCTPLPPMRSCMCCILSPGTRSRCALTPLPPPSGTFGRLSSTGRVSRCALTPLPAGFMVSLRALVLQVALRRDSLRATGTGHAWHLLPVGTVAPPVPDPATLPPHPPARDLRVVVVRVRSPCARAAPAPAPATSGAARSDRGGSSASQPSRPSAS